MTLKLEERIQQCADEILNARDCCGDEQEAMREFEAEHGKFTQQQRKMVRKSVAQQWKQSQKAAGAKILNANQRASAEHALEE